MDQKIKLRKGHLIYLVLLGVSLFGLLKGTFSKGDFIGYIKTGKLVASGEHIYSIFENTWPPLFALFCYPLAVITETTRPILYFLWLLFSIYLFYRIVKYSVFLVLKKELVLRPNSHNFNLENKLIWVPLLLIVKFLLDNLVNVQINILFLASCFFILACYFKEKYLIAGLILALTISLKVYTIFFLFYFLYRKAYKLTLWTLLFIVAFNLMTFVFWDTETTIGYFRYWTEIKVALDSDFVDHKNQSIYGTFFRFFTTLDPGHGMNASLANLDPVFVKRMVTMFILCCGIVPLVLFNKRRDGKTSLPAILEYSIIFNAIPILSPMSWKAYFIFLWLPIFMVYLLIYHSIGLEKQTKKWMNVFFVLSMALLILSADLFSGRYFSDVLESYSAYTFGAGILVVIQFVFYYWIIAKGKKIQLKID